jgi:predicted permease
MQGGELMETMWQDVRYAARLLVKSPAFTGLAVLALALGIGVNTAIFSLANAVLLKPLAGVEDPDQLVSFERIQSGRTYYNFSYPDYEDFESQNQSFSGVASHVTTPLSLITSATERVRGDLVSGNYFSVLGAKAALGRLIEREDDLGQEPVAVLSYGLWRRAFGSDTGAVGQSINLNGHDFTIIGVAARDLGGTSKGAAIDVWLPITSQPQAIPRMSPGILKDRGAGWIQIFGRLKPGAQLEQARVEAATLARRLEQAYAGTNAGRTVSLLPGLGLDSDDRVSLSRFLGFLFAAVILLLLIACANVANLLLVRATARRREIAVRLALGASRGRLIRQLLTEGVMLSTLAGALGLLVAPWAADLILSFQQPAFGLAGTSHDPDLRVLAFTLSLSLLTGILFGLAPALEASKPDLVTSLKDGALSVAPRKSRLQSMLVVSQVALSLVLVVGAGLALRSMQKILEIDKGFEIENRLLMSLDLSIQGYTESAGRSFYEQLIQRLETVPGVISASFAKTVPPNGWSDRMSVFYEGEEPSQEALRGGQELGVRTDVNTVAPRYFQTLGIRLVEGRDFTEADRQGRTAVAIINERLADKMWPGQSAVGKRLAAPFYSGPPRPAVEIIGVARDTKHRTLLADAPPLLYLPVLQAYDGRTTIVVRTETDSQSMTLAIRDEVASIDKTLPLFAVKSMTEQIAGTLWQQRMAASLIGVFAGAALLLAAIGLYGVIANSVAQRTREIGIRMALGAESTDVLGLIVWQGFKLALTGVGAGLGAALALSRVMSSLLYGVSATDPATYAVAPVMLIIVAILASFIPARKASKVDPMIALRYE